MAQMKNRKSTFGRSRLLFFLVSLAVLLPLATGTLSRLAAQDEDGGSDSIYKQLSVFSEVLSLVRRNYVEETPIDGLFAGALEGTMDALDPLATYVPRESVARYRAARDVGSSHSGILLARQRGFTYVLAVEPGSPAEAAGLQGGDVLAEIDGRSTRQLPLWEIESVLAGEPGTRLELRLLRRGRTIDVELALATFERRGSTLEMREEIPIITVSRFDDALLAELAEHLSQIPEVGSLLIDLRGAAGGSSETAYGAAALLASGRLGSLADRSGVIREFTHDGEPRWSGRIVLLTNRSSQGAAEVFAAVLAQSAGAELVGERTFGHAGRRAAVELSNGAEVHFTDAFYSGPDGEKIDRSLVPEVLVTEASRRLSESDVPFDELVLERALERVRDDAVKRAA